MKRTGLYMGLGVFAFLLSLVQLFVLKQGHYFTLFSVGLFVIFYVLHRTNYGNPFKGWKWQQYLFYSLILLLGSLIIDVLGMHLGYWFYPYYTTVFDDIIKYVFEWVLPLTYMLLGYLLGKQFLVNKGMKNKTAGILSFLLGGFLLGLFTEAFNVFVYSWRVISMPLSNAMIGPFFIVFQTIGYWLMVLVPLVCFWIINWVYKKEIKNFMKKTKKKL